MIWGNVGGLIGEQMVRAAFAPLIKFSSLSSDFLALVELHQMEMKLLSDDSVLSS
jgi:hypothetical protein